MTKQELAEQITKTYANCGCNFTKTGIDDTEDDILNVKFELSDQFIITAQADTSYEDEWALYGVAIKNSPKNPHWIYVCLRIYTNEWVMDLLKNWESKYKAPFLEMLVKHDALEQAQDIMEESQTQLRRGYANTLFKLMSKKE